MYNEIFYAEPADHQTDFDKIKEDRKKFEEMSDEDLLEKYNRLSPKIKGNIVDFPIYYCKDADLEFNYTDIGNLFPAANFA